MSSYLFALIRFTPWSITIEKEDRHMNNINDAEWNKTIKETKTDIRYVKKIKEIKNDNLANALISIGNYINKWHIEVQTLGAIN